MSDVTSLVDRHRAFVQRFDSGDLGIPPQLSTVIVTCVDARVDPAKLFSLELGDALIIRNTGGRITPGVVTDMAVLGVLSARWPGDRRLELVLIHHTDCGMSRLLNPELGDEVAARLGLSSAQVTTDLAIADPFETVRSDLERFREEARGPDGLVVSGFVYDVTDGSLVEVVPPGP